MINKLWCDLTTNDERSAWLLAGRGYETGVVSASIQNDLSLAYAKLARYENALPAPQPVNQMLLEDLEPALESLVNYCNNFSGHCGADEVIKAEAVLERLYKSRAAIAAAEERSAQGENNV